MRRPPPILAVALLASLCCASTLIPRCIVPFCIALLGASLAVVVWLVQMAQGPVVWPSSSGLRTPSLGPTASGAVEPQQ